MVVLMGLIKIRIFGEKEGEGKIQENNVIILWSG